MKYLKKECPCGFFDVNLCECKKTYIASQTSKEIQGLLRYLKYK